MKDITEAVKREYFNGDDSLINASYLRHKLRKKPYRLVFEKKDILAAKGDAVDKCYYIENGYVFKYEIINNNRRIYDFLGPGSLLLCSHAIVDTPCQLTCEAAQECEVYAISIPKTKQLLLTDRHFSLAVMNQLTRDLMVTQDLLRKSSCRNSSWRVADLILVLADKYSFIQNGRKYLAVKFTQKQLADMLYMNRVTCSREIHHLEDMGLIDLQTSHIGIRDMEGLRNYRNSCDDKGLFACQADAMQAVHEDGVARLR